MRLPFLFATAVLLAGELAAGTITQAALTALLSSSFEPILGSCAGPTTASDSTCSATLAVGDSAVGMTLLATTTVTATSDYLTMSLIVDMANWPEAPEIPAGIDIGVHSTATIFGSAIVLGPPGPAYVYAKPGFGGSVVGGYISVDGNRSVTAADLWELSLAKWFPVVVGQPFLYSATMIGLSDIATNAAAHLEFSGSMQFYGFQVSKSFEGEDGDGYSIEYASAPIHGPEPGTVGLLALGLLALGYRRLRS